MICVFHPTGSVGDSCPDFTPNPDAESERFKDFMGLEFSTGVEMEDSAMPIDNPFDLDPNEEQWEPEGASY